MFTLADKDFSVRGVTYGSFLPRADGQPFPATSVVERDFTSMRDHGLNTVRTYSLPPPDVVEAATELKLRLLVGLHYEDWRMTAPGKGARQSVLDAGLRAADDALEAFQGRRDALLGIAVGNEVPSDVVRVHGISAVEDTLSRMVRHLHDADSSLLVTYANYPTTEYLDVEGADFLALNVFLEKRSDLGRYLQHLHVVAGDRPVVISELGLAQAVHGREKQAQFLDEQLAEVDFSGAAGACVFAWTDEWGVGEEQVEGWDFGLTTRSREPKPALQSVERWARRTLRDLRQDWPSVSVIVCAYNEEHYIAECLDSLARVDYPNLEVIVCDDGSTDRTLEIASTFPFRTLALEHGGLSAARNAGLLAAHGKIVAYLDADAACDRNWPYHLALSFEQPVDATGGPNLPVPSAGFQERVVAYSPGGPVQVLTADDRAEHVAGCNMAFRRDVLVALGGFDTAYTSAGDDVDICWRLLENGHQIGFAHAAQVWHHRRDKVMQYLRQQRGYGRAERMVSGRHAERFNRLGQAKWAGCLYSSPRMRWPFLRPLLYHGPLGLAPYQRVARWRGDATMQLFSALLPLLVPIALMGLVIAPLWTWALLLPAGAATMVIVYAGLAAAAIQPHHQERHPVRLRLLAGALHAVQPFVRTWGRLRGRPLPPTPPNPIPWAGDRTAWLKALQRELHRGWCSARFGESSDSWDLAIRCGPFLEYRVTVAVVWGWQPLWHGRIIPRPALPLVLLLSAALPLIHLGLIAVPLAIILLVLVEAITVRRLTRSALRLTTAGSTEEGNVGRPPAPSDGSSIDAVNGSS
jgi:glycosyltransferase involved in cell wall biosynthesis